MITSAKIIAELTRIKKQHGMLRPEDIVEAARPKKSPLHSQFDWEDSEAAQKWRLHQARNLIRVVVEYPESSRTPSRIFVSLTPDRVAGGGYRTTAEVLSNDEYRRQLLADALAEMQVFRAKYAALQELAKVFAAMKRTERDLKAAA